MVKDNGFAFESLEFRVWSCTLIMEKILYLWRYKYDVF